MSTEVPTGDVAPPGVGNFGPFLTPPGLRSLLGELKREVMAEFNCHQVGIVEAFNAANQSATVSLVLQRAVYNNPPDGNTPAAQPTIVSYPLLVQVPVIILTGGSSSLQLPVAAGDPCLLLFNDRDLDPWWTQGTSPGLPNSTRVHAMADAVALVGLRSAAAPITDFDSTRARLRNGTSEIGVGALIRVRNSSTSLSAVMDALMTALIAWVNTGGSTPNPATITALEAVKTLADSLLEI